MNGMPSQPQTLIGLSSATVILALLTGCGGGGGGGGSPPPSPPPAPAPTTGSIRFEVATTGAEPDADGYAVSLDGGAPGAATTTSVTTFNDVPNGPHVVQLKGLDCNCSTTSANPSTASVTGGNTTTIHIDVNCPAKSAQPQSVELDPVTAASAKGFGFATLGNQLVLSRTQTNSAAVRGSHVIVDLLDFDSNRSLVHRATPEVTDNFAVGTSVLLTGSNTATVLYRENFEAVGSMVHYGLNSAFFGSNAFGLSPPAPVVRDIVPKLGSDDDAFAFDSSGGITLYQRWHTADRTTNISRIDFQSGTSSSLVPYSTSRLLDTMSVAASPTSAVATILWGRTIVPGTIDIQPLTTTGVPAGAPTTIETAAPTQLRAAGASIAWCQDRYAVVWWAQHSYVNGHVFVQLRGRTLDASGTPLAAAVNLSAPLDFITQTEVKQVDLQCLDGTNFVMAYADAVPSLNILTTDLDLGPVATRNLTVDAAVGIKEFSRPELVYDARQFGVAWQTNADTVSFVRACRAP